MNLGGGDNSKRELQMGRWGDNRDLQCLAQCLTPVTLLPSISACSTPCTSCPNDQRQVASAVSPAPELTPEATAAGLQLPGQARCVAGLEVLHGIGYCGLDFGLTIGLERRSCMGLGNRPSVCLVSVVIRETGCMRWGGWGGAVLHGGDEVTWKGAVVHASGLDAWEGAAPVHARGQQSGPAHTLAPCALQLSAAHLRSHWRTGTGHQQSD